MMRLLGLLLVLLLGGQALEAQAAMQPIQVQEQTAIYAATKDGLAEIGQLEAGVVLAATKETTNYFLIEQEHTYYVPKRHVAATADSVTLEKHIKGPYPRVLVASEQAALYTKDQQLVGSLQKGQRVTLHMTVGGKGVIELFGRRLYVELTQFAHTNQIEPQKNISYEEMSYHLRVFSLLYPQFTKLEEIGKSVEGRPLYALHVGTGKRQLLLDAAIHAREHMTTNVLLEMIDTYSQHYVKGTSYGGYDVRKLLNAVTISFVPMLNPDGVTLVQSGYDAVLNGKAVRQLNGQASIKRWKANVRGIDLNRNFEVVEWQKYKAPTAPAFKNAKGSQPFSEPESVALRDFIVKNNFGAYISYHSSGQVIYYHYNQKGAQQERDFAFASKLSKATGYSLMPPRKNMQTGASQDWFIAKMKKPAFTMEIAPYVGETVVPLKHWPRIWSQQQYIGLLAAKEI